MMNPDIGCLYIVATPIGNYDDITLRAINVLKEVDIIICEEPRQASTLLKKINVTPKELLSLNEHNEAEEASRILTTLFLGKKLALISDCGTPVFSDPGSTLIHTCVENGIRIIPVPGASSLMSTLSILDFKLEKFHFAGFLPRESSQRISELNRLKTIKDPIILMDTPYRLVKLLEELEITFGKGAKITLACDLTLPAETIYRGSLGSVRKQVGARKAEFILVMQPQAQHPPR
jgi:16S rRNA (cytidine1402-2'-O)-methyltransferase